MLEKHDIAICSAVLGC